MQRFNIVLIVTLVLVLLVASPVAAKKPLTTLTMDEIATQPVDGLSFSGVTFAFTVNGMPSTDANYHAYGPGQMEYVQDPSIEGTIYGTLVMVFDKPTTEVAFGVALETMYDVEDAVIVKLYRPGAGLLRETVDLDGHPVILWTEAQYTYSGPAVKTVEITFQPAFGASRFALDNLVFHKHPQS